MRLLAMLALAVADPTQRPTQGPTAGAAVPDAAAPWLAGFQHKWPCDVLFVKGKKVAGTTLGGVVRRLGRRHGISFFAPSMPKIPPPDWQSGGRERWVLQEFETFVARKRGLVGWGQEQTLSPRKRGLDESSRPLMALAERALRVTAVRDPVRHAISACTHFGPCGQRMEGGAAYNASTQGRLDWITQEMGTGQMARFVTPAPESTRAPADFYHAIFVADRLDESLVALALVLELELEDVLYVSAKTSHTRRRPKTEAPDPLFRTGLRRAFYGRTYSMEEPPLPLPPSKRPPDFSADAAMYHDAVARLEATIDKIGNRNFEVHLRRFRKMQLRLIEACARGGARRAKLGRDAGACLYGDQGCGYKCIDAWARERSQRLANRGRSPFLDRAREMARAAAAPAADGPVPDRARDPARGDGVGTVVAGLLERFRVGAAPAAPGPGEPAARAAVRASRPGAPVPGGSVQQSLLDKFRRSVSGV